MAVLSIVVPVYFNEGSLDELATELISVENSLTEIGIQLELLFIDDGSRDKSLDRLHDIRARRPATKVIQLTRNFGGVNAVQTALRFVSGDCFMFLAADLQDPPALILQMAKEWRAGSKYTICVRRERSDPILTRLFASVYYRLLRGLLLKDYPKGGFDLALMDKSFLPYMRDSAKNVNPNLYGFWMGVEPKTIFYKRNERKKGRSRWSFSKKLKFFIDTFVGFSFLPIRLISLVGVTTSALSFFFGVYTVFSAFLGVYDGTPGYATLVSLFLFLLGLIIFMLGVVGEYLWRILDEVNKRPRAVIEHAWGIDPTDISQQGVP